MSKEQLQNLKIDNLTTRLTRLEALMWYVAGSILIKQGIDILPVVSALMGN